MENNYKAIVFDFGNVIIDIDLNLTYQKFAELTFKKPEKIKAIFEENSLFEKFETGHFDENEFRDVVRQILGFPLNDNEIDLAWNSLLLEVPSYRFDYLERLRTKMPIYLLSNTNSIHIKKCKSYFRLKFGISDFTQLFRQSFLSYEIELWKPDYKIYDHVLKSIKLDASDVLFLDDNADNIQAASDLGIHTIKINPPECFTDVLSKIYLDV